MQTVLCIAELGRVRVLATLTARPTVRTVIFVKWILFALAILGIVGRRLALAQRRGEPTDKPGEFPEKPEHLQESGGVTEEEFARQARIRGI